MASSTMELRHLLQMSNFTLFDFDYPISDKTWKEEFEQLFVDYFYFHEIGVETGDRFKQRLKSELRLIIPEYVELYESKLFNIDPLLTTKLNEYVTEENSTSGNQNTSGATTLENDSVGTDYPQHESVHNDIPTNRSVDKGKSSNSNQQSFNDNQVKDYKKVLEGFSGNQNELLKSYRQNIININRMIIDELKVLFILVY